MNVKTRWARLADAKEIANLFKKPAIRKYFGKNEYSYRHIKRWIGYYPKMKTVAIVDGRVVGFISLYQYMFNYMTGYEHIGLFDIAVDSRYQGKGVGSSLVKFAIKHFKKKGFKKIEICVEKNNKKAIGFFESLGFKKEGMLRKHHDKDGKFVDDILMGMLL